MQFATKLVSTRRGTLIAALLIALLAGASILLYLNSYRSASRRRARTSPCSSRSRRSRRHVRERHRPRTLYTVTTIKESQLLEGAMSDPASLKNKVATTEIFAGAQLTATEFGAAGDSLAAQLTDRERIVQPLDSAHGLIDGIEPGNRVDVYAGFNVIPLGADGTPISGGQARPMLRRILADVPVVAVGDKARGSTNVSLAVDDVKAAKLAFASDNGKLCWRCGRAPARRRRSPASSRSRPCSSASRRCRS